MKSHKRRDSNCPEGTNRSEICTGLWLNATQPPVRHIEASDTGLKSVLWLASSVCCHLVKPVHKSITSTCHTCLIYFSLLKKDAVIFMKLSLSHTDLLKNVKGNASLLGFVSFIVLAIILIHCDTIALTNKSPQI